MAAMTRCASLTLAVAIITGGISLVAQRNAGPPVRFEVASIKSNPAGDFRRGMGPGPGGRFNAINVPLRDLVAFAYGVPNNRATLQIVGGPDWMTRERFTVDAVAPSGAPWPAQAATMVRALLAERFNLQAHHEMRVLPVFELARAGANFGARLRRSGIECAARRAARARGVAPPPAPSGPPSAPGSIRPTCAMRQSPGRFAGDAVTMTQLADALAPFAGRVIRDATMLPGYYDIDLEWTLDRPQAPDAPPAATVPTDTPGLVTAIREQLGLKLNGARAPVDVVVIDSADPLIPN
jgi:uncharacterized protein (TIGR03435 family)